MVITISITFIMVCETFNNTKNICHSFVKLAADQHGLNFVLYICIDVYPLLGESGQQEGHIPFYKLNLLRGR